MAQLVTEKELASRVAAAKQDVQGAGIDTTGQGVSVPPDFDLCVFAHQADIYRAASHVVEERTVQVNGQDKQVAFVRFGEISEIVAAVLKTVFYSKPGEVQEA